MQFLIWGLLGLLAGWLTGRVMREYGYGLLIDLVMGAAGGLAGGFIMRSAGPHFFSPFLLPTLAAVAGAAVFTAVAAMASGRKRYV